MHAWLVREVGEPDGGVTIDYLLYFLVRFEGGC
jgi:hypothetical protein